jgi:hypothetical protein
MESNTQLAKEESEYRLNLKECSITRFDACPEDGNSDCFQKAAEFLPGYTQSHVNECDNLIFQTPQTFHICLLRDLYNNYSSDRCNEQTCL